MLGYDWPRVHAILTALPVALLSLAIVLELVSLLFKKESLRRTGLLLLVIGTLGAAAAVGAGLKAEDKIDHGPALHEVLEEHEQLALITLGIFAVLTIWRLARDRKMGRGERAAALVVGLVGFAFLANTGHHGGELVFEHAAGVPNETLQAELMNRREGHEHHAGETHEQDGDSPGHAHADSAADHHHDSVPAAGAHTHAPGTPPHRD
jgi:uncharacterized membrane protein